jgi:hypothetical protein
MWAFGCILLEVKSRFGCLAGWTNNCEHKDAVGPGAGLEAYILEKGIHCFPRIACFCFQPFIYGGCALVQMLVGQPPFKQDRDLSQLAAMAAILGAPSPEAWQVRPNRLAQMKGINSFLMILSRSRLARCAYHEKAHFLRVGSVTRGCVQFITHYRSL